MDNKKPTGAGTPAGRQFESDGCHFTGFDPFVGWISHGKPSRLTRQPKRQWARGRT